MYIMAYEMVFIERHKMKPQLIVNGAAGRMGRRILAMAINSGEFNIVGAIENKNHPDIGKDAGLLVGADAIGVELTSGLPQGADVMIDFSLPEALETTLSYCQANSVALVLATTGLSDAQLKSVSEAATKIPLIHATNTSVGMNLLFETVGNVAAALGDEYDIEIVEQHHRFKKDSPSGTAMTLAQRIAEDTGRDFPDCLTHGREGKEALREKGKIGMHAVRAGDIVGIHEVIYGTLGETITITHTAHSRDTFAAGALRAAKYLIAKPPAQYKMPQVLGLKD